MVVKLTPEQRWECPNCNLKELTHHVLNPWEAAQRFHNCAGLKGLLAPMVVAGTKCKVEAIERGDYVKDEITTKDEDGRPIMSIVTTRENGQDCAVFAPQAQAKSEENK